MRLARAARALLGLGAFAVGGGAHGGPATPADPVALLDAELGAIAGDPARPLASVAVLAIRGGQVVYERQFGRRFIGAGGTPDRPADAATLYRVASISKLVTTLGVMRLVEQGRLALDTDIGDYLGWRLRNPHFPDTPITLRMLLTHRSSLRDDAGYNTLGTDLALEDFLVPGGAYYRRGAMWSDKTAPGTHFSYANLPWGVIATVMEKAAGEPFDRLMARQVLEPLGLAGGYDPARIPRERQGDIATLYRKATPGDIQVWDPKGPWVPQADDYSRVAPVPRIPPGYIPGTNGTLAGPQGALRASAGDLGRVMRMLMGRGELDGKRVLEAATVEAVLQRQWESDGGRNGDTSYGRGRSVFNAWALGNQVFTDRGGGPGQGDRLVEGGGVTAHGHRGDAYGLSSLFAFDPHTRNGIVILVSGTGFDPDSDRGAYSAAPRFEERIVTALWRRAILQRAD